MTAKKHDAEAMFSAFNTQNEQNTQSTQNEQSTPKEKHKKTGYRINLSIDKDFKYYLTNRAYDEHTTVTGYLSDLIRKDMEEYYKNGGNTERWKDIE